ncbi:MAG TPA: hypothetical protein VKR32_03170 [Puia sp.]|nr:hypothetical protein [Puia sp.]
MARKSLAVCGILLMVLFQSGRTIEFWQCELANFGNPNATCDCDKITKDANSDTQQVPSQRQLRDRSADLFDFPVYKIAASNANNIAAVTLRQFVGKLSPGFGKEILQPPRV